MAKKKGPAAASKRPVDDSAATLKDLLSAETLTKLKAQADELKKAEEKQKADKKKQAEEARKAEQKRLENNFEHLLNTSSMNWREYK